MSQSVSQINQIPNQIPNQHKNQYQKDNKKKKELSTSHSVKLMWIDYQQDELYIKEIINKLNRHAATS